MVCRRWVVGFTAVVAASACSAAPTRKEPVAVPSPCRITAAQHDALQSALDHAVERSNSYGGGILRLQSATCGVLWEGAAGSRTHDGDAMRPDDLFEIASITKLFTAVTVLSLLESRGISIDVAVSNVAPPHLLDHLLVWHGKDLSSTLTWRQLLSHRSGLPDYWNDPPFVHDETNAFLEAFLADPQRFWEPVTLLDYVRQLTPVGSPGEKFRYSDSNYVLLGLLVEHLTGQTLGKTMNQRIFTPLEMTHTYLSFREPGPAGARVTGRYEDRRNLSNDRRQSADWAGGGLVSCSSDLGRFIDALRDGKILSAKALAALQTWQPTPEADVDYGLGAFRIAMQTPDDVMWGHDGHGNSFMYTAPHRGITLTGTLNQTQNTWWPLAVEALDVLAPQ